MMTINPVPQREFTLATNDGLALYARSWGDPQASRAAVVLVHGLGEHCNRYGHVAQALVSEGLYVLGFDQRGHGRSPGKQGWIPSYEQPLDDIVVALYRAQTDAPALPLFLYGHSLGGLEVLHYGLARKPKLQGVIATSPALMVSTSALNRLMATLMKHLAPNMIVANGLDTSALSRDPQVVQAYQQDPLVHDKVSVRLGSYMMDMGSYVITHAEEWKLPLYLAHGTADRICHFEGSAQFAARGGEMVTLRPWEGLYHETHNELNKEGVIQTMLDWINAQLE
ncbi:MAG TPA: lysophospholipase [Anaerolineaceae bacterium]|nr:lysophospholipase [Anaerolineaceae bacterium]